MIEPEIQKIWDGMNEGQRFWLGPTVEDYRWLILSMYGSYETFLSFYGNKLAMTNFDSRKNK